MAEVARIGQRIQELREESGLSVSQLAKDSGISKSYVWKLERGESESRPSGDTLYKIARALGTSMSELIGRSVLVDSPIEIPRSLTKFAKDENLRDRDVAMLTQVNFRGKQPETPEDWAFVWHAIKRSVPTKSRSG
ncbi:MAG TPA: helix-turn-helix transcriptional regulator [Solirubrobacterales bacterium]|nr:helix-turn-helix transcriptional regulator [Solirubrobacterales bacterium]